MNRLLSAAAVLALLIPAAAQAETARELFEAIQAKAGPEAHRHRGVDAPGTRDRVIAGGSYRAIGTLVDGFRAGDSDVEITGIVVAARASTQVLQKAVELGANLVISRAPFLGDSMDRPVARPEPALADKIDLIAKNRLVVLRLQDARTAPPGVDIATALPRAIGLAEGRKDGNLADGHIYAAAPASVRDYVRRIKAALPTQAVRLVGDPDMSVSGIAVAGPVSRPNALNALVARSDVNLVIAGEVHETETTPFVMDAIALGQRKALVLIGAIAMEEPPARATAEWLKTITSKPVTYVPAGDGLIEVE